MGEFIHNKAELFHKYRLPLVKSAAVCRTNAPVCVCKRASRCLLGARDWVVLMHEHKSTNPKGLTPLRDWITAAERPASLEGCNNGVVVLGSIVSVAENKKLVKARCMSMLMRLCVNACKCFFSGFGLLDQSRIVKLLLSLCWKVLGIISHCMFLVYITT